MTFKHVFLSNYAESEASLIELSSSNIHCMHKGLRSWPGKADGIGGEFAGTLQENKQKTTYIVC